MKILIFGDVVGRAGRSAVTEYIATIRAQEPIDTIIANGENLAHGKGITRETAQELFDAGVAVLTSGNHVWDVKQVREIIEKDTRILRPANAPPGTPGHGSTTYTVGMTTVAVLNLMGRVFFREQYDDPFRTAETWLRGLPRVQPLISIVDMHAEATSEKRALGAFLDGKVTAVFGTHTHIPTADEQLLPGGTAYITDIGMCGSLHSILGFQTSLVVERFRSQLPTAFSVEEAPPWEVNALLLDVDERTGTVREFRRIREILSAAS